uniref:ERF1_1 domain-containing protein n=1 Tax=Panagrellus redivivus TaxID=6233 RepID=A0A7E4V6S0_PANRE
MKILERKLEEDGSGFVRLICETQDDMWQMLNIVRKGDRVEAWTSRKIKKGVSHEMVANLKRKKQQCVRLPCELEIVVTDVGFDPLFKGIRFEGFTATTTKFVDEGWGHTLEIGLNQPFKLTKRRWLPIDAQRIESSLEVCTEDSMAAIVLHEGVAQIYIVERNITFTKATINMQVARKRSGFGSGHEKSVQEFLETAAKSFMRHIKVDDVKAVIVAGRGFIHNNFRKTLFNVADQMDQPYSNAQKEKFVLVNVSNGYKHSINEILKNPDTAAALAHTAAKEEVKALDKFMGMVMDDPSRAFYGYKHVAMANEHVAIDTLLISDALIRSDNVHERKKYMAFVDDVKLNNGKVLVFSSLHPSGKQLNMMTGIAAILRYPLVELEDEDMDDDEWKSNNLKLELASDDIYHEDELICPRKFYSKVAEKECSFYQCNFVNSPESATEIAKYFDEKSYDKPAKKVERDPDTEEPAPRPHMTLADCIIKKH